MLQKTGKQKSDSEESPTLGSLFAGIGGFDLGFERAGWRTAWQVEINPLCRAVLADRFPNAARFADVNQVGAHCLAKVDCIAAGFPCQDISTSGGRRKDKSQSGLNGKRSGLFFETIRIIREIQPAWVVLENVPALLHSNDCCDLETVICTLADSGYLGLWRVLDAQYFGSPSRRRRIFLVAGNNRMPPLEFMDDASPVVAIPSAFGEEQQSRPADAWAGYTLQANNTPARITLGGELLIAEENGWRQMADRARASSNNGLRLGMDEANCAEIGAAGNAVCPQVAEWIAKKLMKTFREEYRQ